MVVSPLTHRSAVPNEYNPHPSPIKKFLHSYYSYFAPSTYNEHRRLPHPAQSASAQFEQSKAVIVDRRTLESGQGRITPYSYAICFVLLSLTLSTCNELARWSLTPKMAVCSKHVDLIMSALYWGGA